jgi:putative endonuclease
VSDRAPDRCRRRAKLRAKLRVTLCVPARSRVPHRHFGGKPGGRLPRQGFRIWRRWRSPVGEIDIIARRRSLLIFVESRRANLDDAAVGDGASACASPPPPGVARAQPGWAHPRHQRYDLVAPGRIPHHIPAAFDTSS